MGDNVEFQLFLFGYPSLVENYRIQTGKVQHFHFISERKGKARRCSGGSDCVYFKSRQQIWRKPWSTDSSSWKISLTSIRSDLLILPMRKSRSKLSEGLIQSQGSLGYWASCELNPNDLSCCHVTSPAAARADHLLLSAGGWPLTEHWVSTSCSPLTALIGEAIRATKAFQAGEACNKTGLAEALTSSWAQWAGGV